MPLDRAAASKYVENFWLHPCDDGMIYSYVKGPFKVEDERKRLAKAGKLPDPQSWQAVFLPDVDDSNKLLHGKERACFIRANSAGEEIPAPGAKPPELDGRFDIVTFHHDKGLVDCAHYVSRVLTTAGIAVNQPGVDGLVSQLRGRKDTKTLGNRVTKAQGDRILATGIMQAGDVVTYYPYKGGHNSGGYSHSAVYMGLDGDGVERISCHTLSRHDSFFDDAPWSIGDGTDFRFTLIHFSHDDVALPPAFTAALPGWFKINNAGKIDFYRFLASGHAQRVTKKPPSGTANVTVNDQGRGYWFVRPMEIVVCWPNLGEVDRISTAWTAPGRALGEFQLLVNDVIVSATAV